MCEGIHRNDTTLASNMTFPKGVTDVHSADGLGLWEMQGRDVLLPGVLEQKLIDVLLNFRRRKI